MIKMKTEFMDKRQTTCRARRFARAMASAVWILIGWMITIFPHDAVAQEKSPWEKAWQDLGANTRELLMTWNDEISCRHIERPTWSADELGVFEILSETLGFELESHKRPGAYRLNARENARSQFESLAIVEDPALRLLLKLYDEMKAESAVTRSSILNESLEELFRPEEGAISEQMKISIYATALPWMMEHAYLSGSMSTLRKSHEIWESIRRRPEGSGLEISCSLTRNGQAYAITFPVNVWNGHPVDASLTKRDDTTSSRFLDGAIVCHSQHAPSIRVPAQDIESGLQYAQLALRSRDSDGITESLEQLTRGLESLARRRDVYRNEKWMCPLQTVELMALEQHRFAELDRLGRAMSRAFPGSGFYERLNAFESCLNHAEGGFELDARRLWEAYGQEYHWVLAHFAPKHIKTLDKSFMSWVKSRKSNAYLSRRLLGSWMAWNMGDIDRAARFAGNFVKNKPRLVHPQLNSYDLILKYAQGIDIPREFVSSYVYAIMLKNPPLVYRTFEVASRYMTPSQRTEVTDIVRNYSPALAPAAAARFYLAFAPELQQGMDETQRTAVDAWLDVELQDSETPCETLRRRYTWAKKLSQHKDFKGIHRIAKMTLEKNDLSMRWRKVWLAIAQYAENASRDKPFPRESWQ